MLSSIPLELQQLNQWVIAGPDKIPRNPLDGSKADVTDPKTWGSFERCIACNWPHIGFVLSKTDPYCIVDLDSPYRRKDKTLIREGDSDYPEAVETARRHQIILDAFPSYAEFSQSGEGVHIVCKASLPKGVRRHKVEIYSAERYMIFTGNLLKAMPIINCQSLAESLFNELNATADGVPLVQIAGSLTDEQVYNMACGAANAEKFGQLWQGQWQGQPQYPSQSEADFSLISMLAFYSPDNEQCRRMFRLSGLNRPKATDKYLNRMLAKMRAKEAPPIDFSKLYAIPDNTNRNSEHRIEGTETKLQAGGNPDTPKLESKQAVDAGNKDILQYIAQIPKTVAPVYESTEDSEDFTPSQSVSQGNQVHELSPAGSGENLPFPRGFIGELAAHIFKSSIRPVREISLATAVALTAGIVGRCYNISRTGLNQYILLLARTGSGKEECSKAIDAMLAAVRPRFPTIDDFMGPGQFASGQALTRVFDRTQCFVSVMNEFPFLLQAISDPRANYALSALKRAFLDLYSKSGRNDILRPSVYSDTDKNTKIATSPAMTLLGEGTPETFYDKLDSAEIAQGLIPRFCIFEYTGPRVDKNPNAGCAPEPELVKHFEALVATALTASQNRQYCDVLMDSEATALLDAFDRKATEEINAGGSDIVNQLWNRAHLKALKLAALVAVGINHARPVVDAHCAQWAMNLVERDITKLLRKFGQGDVGTGDMRKEADFRRAFTDWLNMPFNKRISYDVCTDIQNPILSNEHVVPLAYLRRRLRSLQSYKSDRMGSSAALSQTIKNLIEAGEIQIMPAFQANQLFGSAITCYVKGSYWQNSLR